MVGSTRRTPGPGCAVKATDRAWTWPRGYGGRPTLRFPGSRRHEARVASGSQHDLDVDAVRHLDAHQLPQRALVRVEVDEPFVDPHLPPVPRLAPLAVRRLPHRHDEPLRWEGDRPRHRDAGALADQLDLLAHVVDLLRVRAADRDSGLLGHGST